MSHPRYFVPHAASAAEPVPSDASAIAHVVDVFHLDARHLLEQEWIVGLDAVGNVHVVPASQRDLLPVETRAQLTHHEVASGRTPRRIAAAELYFFAVELVEHPSDAEGFNDPVYLYGHLSGPWPGDAPMRVPGQLTVTRGDVLSGLVHGAAEAFHYVQTPESPAAPRGYHALLPGDRSERLAEGRGLVLAWPAVPPELQVSNASNGPMVARILHDVLTQLQEDAHANGGPAALARMELPVPSRAMAIADLEMRGYEVKGDVAILRRNHPGLLTRMAEWLRAEKVKVPTEAGAPGFLEVARAALSALPGWPSESERVLRARVRPGGSAPVPTSPGIPAVAAPVTPRPLPPRAPPKPPRPDEWMKDFLNAHAASHPGAPQPKLTRTKPAFTPPSTPAKPGRPDWMADFGAAPAAPPASTRREAPASKPSPSGSSASPAKKPDWMSDFED
ncbi:hypothetical protein HG543_11045 [Pyxidicoccus fallax]|uniref:Uncharacterized protein n=1 Tax=Pyxidicoccus fallax TaxID=394095 RepID=A0A848LA52_9BACT|nr:hypothetical protein [Pyxidicoccus fallax]